MTRAVSGFRGSVIQSASASRRAASAVCADMPKSDGRCALPSAHPESLLRAGRATLPRSSTKEAPASAAAQQYTSGGAGIAFRACLQRPLPAAISDARCPGSPPTVAAVNFALADCGISISTRPRDPASSPPSARSGRHPMPPAGKPSLPRPVISATGPSASTERHHQPGDRSSAFYSCLPIPPETTPAGSSRSPVDLREPCPDDRNDQPPMPRVTGCESIPVPDRIQRDAQARRRAACRAPCTSPAASEPAPDPRSSPAPASHRRAHPAPASQTRSYSAFRLRRRHLPVPETDAAQTPKSAGNNRESESDRTCGHGTARS